MKKKVAIFGTLLITILGLNARAPQVEIKWEKSASMPGPLYAFDAVTVGNRIFVVGGRGNQEGYGRYNYQFDLGKRNWTLKKELLYDRSNHAVVAFGEKIYVFGGNENPAKTEVYDPRTDSWKEFAEMPTPRQHINYSAAASNGKIYVIGGIQKRGERDYVITDKNEEYDPATDIWSEKAPLPAPRQVPAVVSFKNSIYVISGTDGKWADQSTVFLYHPETDTWETRSPMPEARYINGVAVVKDKIVVLTGKRSDVAISKAFLYDPELDRWHSLGQLPVAFMLAGVTSAKNRLYVLGGSTHEHILSTCWEADIGFSETLSTDRVAGHNPSPLEGREFGHVGIPWNDRRLFIIGGFRERDIYSGVYSISVFDLISGDNTAWNRQTSLPKALQGHTAVAVHDHIYVIGGLEGFTENRRAIYSDDVFSAEITDSHLSEWKREKSLPHPLGYHATAIYKDIIITSGGQNPADISTVYKVRIADNGKINDWETAGHLPNPIRGHASVMVKDNLFILGGHDDKEFFADVFSAPVDRDGKLGEWEHTMSLPLPLVHFGAVEHNGRIYIFGGQDAEDSLHQEVYSAEVASSKLGDWRKETHFPVPQSRMTVNIMDKWIIVSGGGFGWMPPVYSAVFVSEIGANGILGEWQKIGNLPIQLAFHAAVICPEKQP